MDWTFVKIILCGILMSLVFVTEEQFQKKKPVLKFRNLEAFENKTWFTNVSFGISAINRYTRVANIRAIPLRPLKYLDLEVNMFKRLSGWKPWVFSGNVSLCGYMKTKKFNPIINVIKIILEKYSNINHTCPITHEIILQDINLDDLQLGASVIPDGYYRIDFNVSERKIWVALCKFYFDVKE